MVDCAPISCPTTTSRPCSFMKRRFHSFIRARFGDAGSSFQRGFMRRREFLSTMPAVALLAITAEGQAQTDGRVAFVRDLYAREVAKHAGKTPLTNAAFE